MWYVVLPLMWLLLGLFCAALMAWFDIGEWDDSFMAGLLVFGCILFWPMLGMTLAFTGLREAGRDHRRIKRNREAERERELAIAEAQLRKEGYLP